MNKKIVLISVGVLIALGVAYWLISPLWRNVVLNESVPGAVTVPVTGDVPPTGEPVPVPEKKTTETKDRPVERNVATPAKEISPDVPLKVPPPPVNQPTIISRASMVAGAHDVSGEALIVKSGSETYLRFENLKTINGPDLHIYLSSGLNTDDAVDLGAIRATEGSVNYPVPAGTDLSKYKNALIWCRPFRVLFSYARL